MVDLVKLEKRIVLDGDMGSDIINTAADMLADASQSVSVPTDALEVMSQVLGETVDLALAPIGDINTKNGEALLEAVADASAGKVMVFVDGDLADSDLLAAGMPADAQVHVLDVKQGGLQQILTALEGQTNISAIHILSHGKPGVLQLGNESLQFDALSATQTAALKDLGASLSDEADILIYGCDFAGGNEGTAAVANMAKLTGADVAASNDLTGNADLGGDWELEITSGLIEEAIVINPANAAQYAHVLSVVADVTGVNFGTGTDSNDLRLWLDASDNSTVKDASGDVISGSGDVATWEDKSGHGNDATSSGARPSYTSGSDFISFDASQGDLLNAALSATGGLNSSEWEVFIVANIHSAATDAVSNGEAARLVSFVNDASSDTASGGAVGLYYDSNLDKVASYNVDGTGGLVEGSLFDESSNSTYDADVSDTSVVFTSRHTADGKHKLMIDGGNLRTDASAGATDLSSSLIAIGHDSAGGGFIDMDIQEIIVFNRELNTTERFLMNNYLSTKWGIDMDANDLFVGNSADHVNDISGIGKQSNGNVETGTSGGLAVTNSDFLTDSGDYFMFAHDNNTGDGATVTTGGSTHVDLVSRSWYGDVTDVNSNGGTVDIRFDMSALSTNRSSTESDTSYYLVIDSNDNGFGDDDTFVVSTTNTDGTILFSGVDLSALDGHNFTIGVHDTTPPSSLDGYALDLVAGSDSGTSNSDDLTNDNTPEIQISSLNGVAMTPGDVIEIVDTSNGDAVVGSYTVQDSDLTAGNWNGTTQNITLSALADGDHALKVRLTDAAGNNGIQSSATLTVSVDTGAGSSLVAQTLDLVAISDSGSSDSDDLTNDNTPDIQISTLNGVAMSDGDIVQIIDTSNGNAVVGSYTVVGADLSSGLWSGSTKNITLNALSDGDHVLKVRIIDAAGNIGTESSAALTLSIDTAASSLLPQTLDLLSASDTGSSNTDNLTNVSTPEIQVSSLNGVAMSVGDVIQVIDTSNGDAVVGGYTVTGGDLTGSVWNGSTQNITLSVLSDGNHALKVRILDVAGNVGATSTEALTIEVDTVAPSLTALSSVDGSNSYVAGDDLLLTFDKDMVVTSSGIITFTDTSDGSGSFSIDLASLGSHSVTANGREITINPATDLETGTQYTISVSAGAFTDAAGNDYAGFSSSDDPLSGDADADNDGWNLTSREAVLSLADDGNILEGSEDGEIITVNMAYDTFVASSGSNFTTDNITISNQPAGVTIGAISRVSDTQIQILLSGNSSTNYDEDISDFSVSIDASLLNGSTATLTRNSGVTFVAAAAEAAAPEADSETTNEPVPVPVAEETPIIVASTDSDTDSESATESEGFVSGGSLDNTDVAQDTTSFFNRESLSDIPLSDAQITGTRFGDVSVLSDPSVLFGADAGNPVEERAEDGLGQINPAAGPTQVGDIGRYNQSAQSELNFADIDAESLGVDLSIDKLATRAESGQAATEADPVLQEPVLFVENVDENAQQFGISAGEFLEVFQTAQASADKPPLDEDVLNQEGGIKVFDKEDAPQQPLRKQHSA